MRYDKAERDRAEKAQRRREKRLAKKNGASGSKESSNNYNTNTSKASRTKIGSNYNKTKWIKEESARVEQQKIDKEFQKRLDENSAKHKEQTILKVIKKSE